MTFASSSQYTLPGHEARILALPLVCKDSPGAGNLECKAAPCITGKGKNDENHLHTMQFSPESLALAKETFHTNVYWTF